MPSVPLSPPAAAMSRDWPPSFGPRVFQIFGVQPEPVVAGAAVLAVYWLGLWWLYTKRVFVRI